MAVGEKHQVQHRDSVPIQKRGHGVPGFRQAAVDEHRLASRRRDQRGIALSHVQEVHPQSASRPWPLGSRSPTPSQPCHCHAGRQGQPGPEAAMLGRSAPRAGNPAAPGRQKTARRACLPCRTGPRKGACRRVPLFPRRGGQQMRRVRHQRKATSSLATLSRHSGRVHYPMSRLRHWLFAAALASAGPACLVDHSGLNDCSRFRPPAVRHPQAPTGGAAAGGSQVGGGGQAGTSAISQGGSSRQRRQRCWRGRRRWRAAVEPGGRRRRGAAARAGGTSESSGGRRARPAAQGAAARQRGHWWFRGYGGALSSTSDAGADAATEPTDADRCVAKGGIYADGTCVIDCSAAGTCGSVVTCPSLVACRITCGPRWLRRRDRLQQGRRLRHRVCGFQVMRGHDQLRGQLVRREL
jgi:hypothetical protein